MVYKRGRGEKRRKEKYRSKRIAPGIIIRERASIGELIYVMRYDCGIYTCVPGAPLNKLISRGFLWILGPFIFFESRGLVLRINLFTGDFALFRNAVLQIALVIRVYVETRD